MLFSELKKSLERLQGVGRVRDIFYVVVVTDTENRTVLRFDVKGTDEKHLVIEEVEGEVPIVDLVEAKRMVMSYFNTPVTDRATIDEKVAYVRSEFIQMEDRVSHMISFEKDKQSSVLVQKIEDTKRKTVEDIFYLVDQPSIDGHSRMFFTIEEMFAFPKSVHAFLYDARFNINYLDVGNPSLYDSGFIISHAGEPQYESTFDF